MATNRQKVSQARNYTKRRIAGLLAQVQSLKDSPLLDSLDRNSLQTIKPELQYIIKSWDKSFVKDCSDKTIDALAKEL